MRKTYLSKAKHLIVAAVCAFNFSNCLLPPQPAHKPIAKIQKTRSLEQEISDLVKQLTHKDEKVVSIAAHKLEEIADIAPQTAKHILEKAEYAR